MFNKIKNETNMNNNSIAGSQGGPILNIIGAGTQVVGEIECDGDIRIDGYVKGTITSKAKIVIGPTGAVEGDLYCENADISGKIFGAVEIDEMLFLKSSAYLEGDITTGKFVVEAGAKFNGNCRMGVKEIKPNEKPSSAATNALQKEAV
jgi:cytoskeletal protein CcmA (bactofilin family)